MDNIRVISDTHFEHGNIIDYCGRPVRFQNKILAHLDQPEALCEMFIHVGDFGFLNKAETVEHFLLCLPSDNVILVAGNHDLKCKRILKGCWSRVIMPSKQPFKIEYAGLKFAIQHRPFGRQKYKVRGKRLWLQKISDFFTKGASTIPEDADVVIHGHIHELGQRYRWVEGKLIVNACVEHWDYKSFSLDEVVKEYHERKQFYSTYRPRFNSRKH